MIADIVNGDGAAGEIASVSGADTVAAMTFDVSDEASVKGLVAETLERFGRIDILVNNAALYSKLPPIKATEIDVPLWDRVMAVNVRGSFLMVKYVAPHMQVRRSGKIINIASGTAYKGVMHMLHYATSKGAIVSMTRALSREFGEYNINVNTLAPGLVLSDTGIENTAHHDEARVPVRNSRAFKRDSYPEDLLGALIFLASSDSDFITGQTIAVDGGSINT
jgi:NAD(P)-dependent dehydrogenase (short-subunit alcohol dehydrogenase family)